MNWTEGIGRWITSSVFFIAAIWIVPPRLGLKYPTLTSHASTIRLLETRSELAEFQDATRLFLDFLNEVDSAECTSENGEARSKNGLISDLKLVVATHLVAEQKKLRRRASWINRRKPPLGLQNNPE